MRKYRLVAKKGEGTFSEVLKAQNVKDGKYHAIKCMKNRFESIDQVNNLREIQALRRLSPHEHIISLEEVLYDQPTGRLALVFELMDANLYELIRGRRHYLNAQLVKGYMWQLMKSLDHMHRKGIFHRDIKPENILIESSSEVGKGLKLADFGSCRGIYSKQPYTEYISTRWYRAPECLLTDGYYGPEMDLWGAGCVMFEITSLYPLFPGSNEVDQISRIHKVLGTPSAEILQKFKSKGASHISFDFPPQKPIGIAQLIPHASADAVDLIVKLLKYDASERISAREAMRHPYFKENREEDARKAAATSTVSSGGEPAKNTFVNTGGVNIQDSVSVTTNKAQPANQAKSVQNNKSFKLSQEISGLSDNAGSVTKALPSIGGAGGNSEATNKGGNFDSSMTYGAKNQSKGYNGFNQNTSENSNNNNGLQSSLPPIAVGSIANNNTSNSKLNDSSVGNNASLRRKKKGKTTTVPPPSEPLKSARRGQGQGGQAGAGNTEQVLRTYGLAGKTAILNSNDTKSDARMMDKQQSGQASIGGGAQPPSSNSSYNHANRHYVAKR